ncbi:MAG: plastocyanin [Phenylobacterium sp.]|jgi:plastocyanin
MKHYLNLLRGSEKLAMGLLITALCSTSFYSTNVLAASISGQIDVLKKGGRKKLISAEYAVVYLSASDATKGALLTAAPVSDKPIIINQKKKRFFPRLMPLVKGQTVHFYNQDELEHNVFSTEEKNSFDLGRYVKGDFRPVTYDTTGNYKVYCNIHQKMILDILVLDNQYFTVTDEDGQFTLDNVPVGDYQLNVWHIYGGKSEQAVTITDQPLTLPGMAITSTKVVREIVKHANKFGKKYKKKGRYRR